MNAEEALLNPYVKRALSKLPELDRPVSSEEEAMVLLFRLLNMGIIGTPAQKGTFRRLVYQLAESYEQQAPINPDGILWVTKLGIEPPAYIRRPRFEGYFKQYDFYTGKELDLKTAPRPTDPYPEFSDDFDQENRRDRPCRENVPTLPVQIHPIVEPQFPTRIPPPRPTDTINQPIQAEETI